jgi:hypothetical protein
VNKGSFAGWTPDLEGDWSWGLVLGPTLPLPGSTMALLRLY